MIARMNQINQVTIRPSVIACFFCLAFVIAFSCSVFKLPIMGMLTYISIFFLFFISIISLSKKSEVKVFIFSPKISLPLVFGIIIICFSLSLYDSYIYNYFSISPLRDADLYNRWHQDTAFNLSLIQSIINFGYPSVALDGSKLTAYHVLSHYIDALLLLASGLDPYDSYGFTSFVKSCFFIFAILLMCIWIFEGEAYSYVAFLFAAPLIISSWHAISSHALWAPSVILVLSAIRTYDFIKDSTTQSWGGYVGISAISVLLCVGKISTGLAYITLVFSIVLFRDIKNIRIYVCASFLLIFIIAYQKFINYSYGISSSLDFSALLPSNIISHVLSSNIKYESFFLPLTLVSLAILHFKRNEFVFRLLFGIVASYSCVFIITEIMTSFSWSDKFYFFQGLYATVILMLIVYLFSGDCFDAVRNWTQLYLCGMPLLLLSFFTYQPLLSLKEFTAKRLHDRVVFLATMYSDSRDSEQHSNLTSLVEYIASIKKESSIKNKDIALFIPASVIDNEMIKKEIRGRTNFYTMNIYAATGVQVIRGVIGSERAYGFANYNNESRTVNNIDYTMACSVYGVSGIITIESYLNNKYHYHKC